MSAAREIQIEFDRFQEIHDDTVKALIAYITQPSSLELLREHGFVGFDRSGQRIADPDSIDINNREDYSRLLNEIEKSKDALKDIYDQATQDLGTSDPSGSPLEDEDAGSESPVETIGPSALEPIIHQISTKTSAGVLGLDQTVNAKIGEMVGELAREQQTARTRIREIWRARGRITTRFLVVILLFGAGGWIVGNFAPDLWTKMWSSLPEWMIQGAVSSTITSLVLSIGFFIFIGFTNANLRIAFGSTTTVLFKLALLRRRHQRKIRKTTEEELAKAKAIANDSIDSINHALLKAVVRWLENDCTAYGESVGELRQIGQRVSERGQLVDALVGKISAFRHDLGAQVRERSEAIRSAAVSTHMSTIRQAAEDVERLRETISQIKEKARSATVS